MLKMTSLLGCLLFIALVCFQIAYAEVVVVIPDSNLEAVIREAIGKPEGDITDTDLQTITQLNGYGRGIIDLTGLEYCTNLTWLSLGSNQIADITPLANLTALTGLYLYSNQIADISPLANLTELTELSLSSNQIADISPLANLTALTELYLNSNQITDITPLANLTALTWLYLSSNQITDITLLANLTELTELALSSNQITDITPLANLTELTILDLGSNQITDITPLANLTELYWLYLAWNRITDITPVANLTVLTVLNLGYNRITDISPLANLTELIELNLYHNQITDITPLANLTALTRLSLGSNQITDITPLANLTELYLLYLSSNQITDITPLANLTELTWLDLSYNQITDIQPLVDNLGIGSGDYVYIHGNSLSYISLKTHIPTLEGRGVYVDYSTKGTVSLDIAGPPTWSYTLTHQGDYIYNWFYEGSGITGASVTGEAAAAGWTVEYTPTLVTFANSTPMTSGSVSGFEITGAKGGTGSWLCGRGSGSIEGPVFQLGDVSGNGTVSAYDAAMVLQYVVGLITLTDAQKEAADVNKSGVVTALDAALILQYTVGLITQFPVQQRAPILTAKDENQILTKIIAELENVSSDSRNGVVYPDRDGAHLTADQKHVLEQLKQLIWRQSLPGHTALLQNYPNPFNPETWIPYKLAQDASVTIRIYDVKGQVVRQLDLGKQKAGRYVDKEKAAHWDGKNQTGKAVSSGLYFYTLKAGNFQATRRMVIVK